MCMWEFGPSKQMIHNVLSIYFFLEKIFQKICFNVIIFSNEKKCKGLFDVLEPSDHLHVGENKIIN